MPCRKQRPLSPQNLSPVGAQRQCTLNVKQVRNDTCWVRIQRFFFHSAVRALLHVRRYVCFLRAAELTPLRWNCVRFCVTTQEDIVDSASRWKRGLTDVFLGDLYPLLQNYQEISKMRVISRYSWEI